MKCLIALVMTLGLALGVAPAYADSTDPVVIAADVDLTTNTCVVQNIQVSNLGNSAQVFVYDAKGDLYLSDPYANSGSYHDSICGSSAIGVWTIEVAKQVAPGDWRYTYGHFSTFKPVLDLAQVSSARRAHIHRVTERLSIHGTPMANRPVVVSTKVSHRKRVRVVTQTTDGNGFVQAKCPKWQRCTITFDYDQGYSTAVVKTR